MLEILDPQGALDPSLLEIPGSFAWWYLDLVEPNGDGLVLIWAFGLPFLRDEGLPRERPSLALSIYRGGQPDFVLLSELGSSRLGRERWEMGDSLFEEHVEAGQRRLHIRLRVPTPRGTLEGEIETTGPILRGSGEGGVHGWSPLMGLGRGQVSLRCGTWRTELQGTCYRDRNECARPLDQLGITRWTWGRAGLGDRLFCWYLIEGEQPSARVFYEEDGRLEALPVEVRPQRWRRDRYGLRWAPELQLEGQGFRLHVEQERPVDRSPFYLRHSVRASLEGASGRGWGEQVVPGSIGSRLLRPLVEMRIQRLQNNSIFLPLFAGPRPTLRWL